MRTLYKTYKRLKKAGSWLLSALFVQAVTSSCIEPPLHLAAQELLVQMETQLTDLELVWNVDVDWKTEWHYGWDADDEAIWGKIGYTDPNGFEVRRYFTGQQTGVPHTQVDGFSVAGKSFRRTYEFGYYDLLLWSQIENPEFQQVVEIDDKDLNEVTATTSVTRSVSVGKAQLMKTRADEEENEKPVALYNQPEIFYSTYVPSVYISRDTKDYDYYNEAEGVWVKRINCTLQPLVYIYMVQIILCNNDDGRVKSVTGDCALSAFANGTSVTTGHTNNKPCMVYFNTRMKKDLQVNGSRVDIIGGKLTTFGLCDMQGYGVYRQPQYQGSRTDLPNLLYVELNMSGGSKQALKFDVTDQVRSRCHGGVITIWLDCSELDNPEEKGEGSIFHPTVEDYENLDYDIPLG